MIDVSIARHRKKSKRYLLLERELRNLKKSLLPARFSPTGTYSEKCYSCIFAYRLLAHAAFEAYLEDRVKEIGITALQNLRTNGTITRPIVHLLAYSGLELNKPIDEFPKALPSNDCLIEKVQKAGNNLFSVIRNNHGIKTANLFALLLRVGISFEDFDTLWLTEMDNFGVDRGAVAHTSWFSYRTTNFPDPQSELNRITMLLVGLRPIDGKLNYLKD